MDWPKVDGTGGVSGAGFNTESGGSSTSYVDPKMTSSGSVFGSVQIAGSGDAASIELYNAKAQEEARLKAEEEARRKAEEEARLKAQAEAKLKAQAEAKLKAEAEVRLKAEAQKRQALTEPPKQKKISTTIPSTTVAKSNSPVKKTPTRQLYAAKPPVETPPAAANPKANLEVDAKASLDLNTQAGLNADVALKDQGQKKADNAQNATVKATNSDVYGQFSVGSGTLDVGGAKSFQELNIAEGDAASEPLRTTMNGVKILSTDPNVSPENIKIEDMPCYYKVSMPNGQNVMVNKNDQHENAQIVFNGNKMVLCNLHQPIINGNGEGDSVYAIGCTEMDFNMGDDKPGLEQKVTDNFIFQNCKDVKITSNGSDNVLALEGSDVTLRRGTYSGLNLSDKTLVSTDGTSKAKYDDNSILGGSHVYQLGSSQSDVVSRIDASMSEVRPVNTAAREAVSDQYNFSFGGYNTTESSSASSSESSSTKEQSNFFASSNVNGKSDSKSLSDTKTTSTSDASKKEGAFASTNGTFKSDMPAFENLNIEEGSPESVPLAVTPNGVKILSSDPNYPADQVKITDIPSYYKVSLPTGQEVLINKCDHPENAQVVVNGSTFALCNLNHPVYNGVRGDENVAVINCEEGSYNANDAGRDYTSVDNFVFVNSHDVDVNSHGEDTVLALGSSDVNLISSRDGKASGSITSTVVASDASSNTGSRADMTQMNTHMYQNGYTPLFGLNKINKQIKK